MGQLSNKVEYGVKYEPITLRLLESLALAVSKSHGGSQKCSEIWFFISNNLMVRMDVGERS